MTGKLSTPSMAIVVQATLLTIFLLNDIVFADDKKPIPEAKEEINNWFNKNVKPFKDSKSMLDAELVKAEQDSKVVKVCKKGKGDFTTITDAIKSVPDDNKKRVVISIEPGDYIEKITIENKKPFVTLYGTDPLKMPTLSYAGTNAQYGTVDSATLIVKADYFTAANLIIKNSAPKPDPFKQEGAQAVALRISGNKTAFHNCRVYGFQDTLLDDRGFHFFKDCYVEGSIDFVWGSGTSLYLNTELHVLGGTWGFTVITAQARENDNEKTGFSFVHCSITGTGNNTYLGRAWKSRPQVVYAYTNMTRVITPQGWSDNNLPDRDNTVFFGEFKSTGPGATPSKRVKYAKKLSQDQVQPFISLGYIQGSKWLLPPPTDPKASKVPGSRKLKQIVN